MVLVVAVELLLLSSLLFATACSAVVTNEFDVSSLRRIGYPTSIGGDTSRSEDNMEDDDPDLERPGVKVTDVGVLGRAGESVGEDCCSCCCCW